MTEWAVGPVKGGYPGQHFVQHATQGVEIAPAVQRGLAGPLFRTHVRHRTHHQAAGGEPVGGGLVHRAGHAEIGDDGMPAGEHDVLGLQIPVHHADAVGVDHRFRHVAADAQGIFQRQLPLPVQPVAQRLALHIGHDVVEQLVGARAGADVRPLS